MSWSANGVGRAAAVAAAIKTQIDNTTCQEPEQSFKAKAGDIIATALAAMPENAVVEVNASGSQSTPVDGKVVNSLSLTIKPIYGFRE